MAACSSNAMTLGGVTTGTDAGTYTATFTPGANYKWSDGSTGAKTVVWRIGKAAGSLSLNKTSMKLTAAKKTDTITVTRAGDGVNLSTYFKYPQEVRRLIYTTNAIEGFNRQLRKVTKAKSVFPSDDSLLKMLYLAMMDITKKWTGRRQDWSLIHAQMAIYFAERMPE